MTVVDIRMHAGGALGALGLVWLAQSVGGAVAQLSSKMHAGSPEGIEANATFVPMHAFSATWLEQGVVPGPLQYFVQAVRGSPLFVSTYSGVQVSV